MTAVDVILSSSSSSSSHPPKPRARHTHVPFPTHSASLATLQRFFFGGEDEVLTTTMTTSTTTSMTTPPHPHHPHHPHPHRDPTPRTSLLLTFRDAEVEDEYLSDVAARRWPVLVFIVMFDQFAFFSRLASKLLRPPKPINLVLRDYSFQFLNMIILYIGLFAVHRWSKRVGRRAARHEEVILTLLMAAAITIQIMRLPVEKAQDYVLFCFFLICISTFMQVREP